MSWLFTSFIAYDDCVENVNFIFIVSLSYPLRLLPVIIFITLSIFIFGSNIHTVSFVASLPVRAASIIIIFVIISP